MLSFFCAVVDMISNVVMFKTTLMQPKKTKLQDCFEHDLHVNVMVKHTYFVLVKICYKQEQLKLFTQ